MENIKNPLRELSSSQVNTLSQLGCKNSKKVKCLFGMGNSGYEKTICTVKTAGMAPASPQTRPSSPRDSVGGSDKDSPLRRRSLKILATPSELEETALTNASTMQELDKKQVEVMKTRLQLAYYKYRTNQVHLSFRQLKQRHLSGKSVRKLACTTSSTTPCTPTKKFASGQHSTLDGAPVSTPTSFKAAKSLLHLLSSSATLRTRDATVSTLR